MRFFEVECEMKLGFGLVMKPEPRIMIGVNDGKTQIIPLGRSLKRLLPKEDMEIPWRIKHGGLEETNQGLVLIRQDWKEASADKLALVIVATPPGVGGKVEYLPVEGKRFPSNIVSVPMKLGESIWCEHLLLFKPGDSMRIVRTGDLEGARSVIPLSWDGRKMDDGIERMRKPRASLHP